MGSPVGYLTNLNNNLNNFSRPFNLNRTNSNDLSDDGLETKVAVTPMTNVFNECLIEKILLTIYDVSDRFDRQDLLLNCYSGPT